MQVALQGSGMLEWVPVVPGSDAEGFEAYATALNGPSNNDTSDLTDTITLEYGEPR